MHKKSSIVCRIYCLLLFFLTSCGYQWASNQSVPTVVVPYAAGDEEGSFTAQVIQALTSSGIAKVQPSDATYRLKISLQGDQNQVVGYRKNPQKVNSKVRKNIVATEGRRQISAEVILYEKDSGEIAKGPYVITASADYDYIDGDSIVDLAFTNSRGVFTTVLPFSLGQLEPSDSAQEAAGGLIYERLAQKIADTIFSAW